MWADETAHIRRTLKRRVVHSLNSLFPALYRGWTQAGKESSRLLACACSDAHRLYHLHPPTPSLKSLFPPGSVKAHVTKTRESSIRWLDKTNWRFLITINCDKNWFVSPHPDQWEGMHTHWFVTVITNRVAGLIFPRQYSWTSLRRNGS